MSPVRSRPDLHFVLLRRVADKGSQNDPRIGALHGGDLVNAAGVEEIEVSLLQIDAVLVDASRGGVGGEGAGFDVRLDLGRPETAVKDSLRAPALMSGVLKAENAGELVREAGNGIVEPLLA